MLRCDVCLREFDENEEEHQSTADTVLCNECMRRFVPHPYEIMHAEGPYINLTNIAKENGK